MTKPATSMSIEKTPAPRLTASVPRPNKRALLLFRTVRYFVAGRALIAVGGASRRRSTAAVDGDNALCQPPR